MTFGREWGARLAGHLVEAGVPEGEARRLAGDSVAEAREAGREPAELYGPAVAYARELARTLRAVAATAAPLARARGPVVLRLSRVTKRYRRRTVLGGVNLVLRAGEVAAVVGANGSGKSTLLNICAGVTRASGGLVERTARVGYAPQQQGVSPLLTPAEHFRLFGAVHGMGRRRSVAVGEQLAGQLGWRPRADVVAAHLSGGTRQKLNVVLSELNRPDLILLDEPYQGFDQTSYLDFWDQVFRWRDAGAGVLVVTHLLHDLERVDHVLELHRVDE
ncbi:ATP-binding cassette domain-containing protein [Streptomyces hoynatensis]|uniref:ABC transporter ATP-binding protein n=1 Tax=Streptomyces hoynatensis TaxID=1141874 RepID=A0A3A9YWG1_9ACTN|nr:ABC transporter ATP-binding protein [Streptomyces hoynatensis]RKN40373.1 ABC transporter ATP-binding protein [Streptomyces hoynatensis]